MQYKNKQIIEKIKIYIIEFVPYKNCGKRQITNLKEMLRAVTEKKYK
jgi:hypothetical protein